MILINSVTAFLIAENLELLKHVSDGYYGFFFISQQRELNSVYVAE